MGSQEDITALLKAHYSHLAAEYGVKRIGVFGSHTSQTATKMSDVDMVVEFARPIGLKFIELCEYLEYILGTQVDVLTPAGIDAIRRPAIAQNMRESVVYVEAG